MKIVDNFFNKLVSELDAKYYPHVKYYRDNIYTTKIHHTVELFNNGVLTYDNLINKLCSSCNETKENITTIVNKYIVK